MWDGETRLLTVRLFAGLEVYFQGQRIYRGKSRSRIGDKIIARLVLARGEPVSVEELCRLSGYDENEERAYSSLKVVIHRLRKAFTKVDLELGDCIITCSGSYAWNMGMSEVDLFEMESLCTNVEKAVRKNAVLHEEIKLLLAHAATKLLPEMSRELWVCHAASAFERRYMECVRRVFSLMWQKKRYEEIERICHLGLAESPTEFFYWDQLKRASHELAGKASARDKVGKLKQESRGNIALIIDDVVELSQSM